MPAHPKPSLGQVTCQGLRRHHWDPCPAPFGYRSKAWVTVHFRCPDCQTIRHSHVDRSGRVTHDYDHPDDWVTYSLEDSPTTNDRRLAYIKTLDSSLVSKNRPERKAPKPQRGNLRAVS